MSYKFKLGITALVAALFVSLGAFGLGSVSADLNTSSGPTECTASSSSGTTSVLVSTAQGSACLDDVYIVGAHVINPAQGSTTSREDCKDAASAAKILEASVIILKTSATIFICVNTDNNNDSTLSFDSDDVGKFDQPSCGDDEDNDDNDIAVAEWTDDACNATQGSGTDNLSIEQDPQDGDDDNDLDVVIVRYTCSSTAARTTLSIVHSEQDGDEDVFTATIWCRGDVDTLTLTAIPDKVEIVPAAGSVAHSLIDLQAKDSSGGPVFDKNEVVFTTDKCAIESSEVDTAAEYNEARDIFVKYNNNKGFNNAEDVEDSDAAENGVPSSDTKPQEESVNLMDVIFTGGSVSGTTSRAATILHCENSHTGVLTGSTTPGIATITAVVSLAAGADKVATVKVTVVGPPASIQVSASPLTLRCGEKSEITAKILDAAQQNVSDHTLVEMVTNIGGVLGGTGAVVGFAGPVVPISSTVSETFDGIAKAFLLTSESHSGPYEVVVASGGGGVVAGNALGGIFSTPPVVAQVTVTCALPTPVVAAAPTITAPRTGTGITPPSTGDAGLIGSSSSSSAWALYALAGTALAFALAGLAAAKASRR